MNPIKKHQLINYLTNELAIPAGAIALAEKKGQDAPLPMVLWQYGLVSLKQLEQIWNWMEAAY